MNFLPLGCVITKLWCRNILFGTSETPPSKPAKSKAKLLAHGGEAQTAQPRGHVLTGSRKNTILHDDMMIIEAKLNDHCFLAYTHPYSGSLPGTLKLPFSQVWVECPWGPAWVGPWVVCPAWVTSTWAAQIQGAYLKILVFEEKFHCKLKFLSLPSSLTWRSLGRSHHFLIGNKKIFK